MEKINEIVGIAEEIVGKSLTEYQRACHSGFDAIRTLQRLDLPADAEKRQRVLRKFVDDVELFGSIMKKHYNGIGNPSDEHSVEFKCNEVRVHVLCDRPNPASLRNTHKVLALIRVMYVCAPYLWSCITAIAVRAHSYPSHNGSAAAIGGARRCRRSGR